MYHLGFNQRLPLKFLWLKKCDVSTALRYLFQILLLLTFGLHVTETDQFPSKDRIVFPVSFLSSISRMHLVALLPASFGTVCWWHYLGHGEICLLWVQMYLLENEKDCLAICVLALALLRIFYFYLKFPFFFFNRKTLLEYSLSLLISFFMNLSFPFEFLCLCSFYLFK